MSDQETIQGLWRVVSGDKSTTHFLFTGNTVKRFSTEVDVDDKLLAYRFELNETSQPKRMVMVDPDEVDDPEAILECSFYQWMGDQLQLNFGRGSGEFPKFTDGSGRLIILERDHGPIPQARKAPEKKEIGDDILGRLEWSEGFDWYAGEVDWNGQSIDISLSRDEWGSIEIARERARRVVNELKRYAALAAAFAAERLLPLKNDDWLAEEEEPVTAEAFRDRLSLTGLGFGADGEIALYYDDGDLFAGSSIQVVLDADDVCVGAELSG